MDYSQEYIELLKFSSSQTEKIAELQKELSQANSKIAYYQKLIINTQNSTLNYTQNYHDDEPLDLDNFNSAFEKSLLDKKEEVNDTGKRTKNSASASKSTPVQKSTTRGSKDGRSTAPSSSKQEFKVPEKKPESKAVKKDDDDGIVRLGTVIGWTTLFKNSHPGSLSHLRKPQREQLQKCMLTFIHDTIPDLEDGCFVDNPSTGKREVGLPEALVDDFYEWFDDQLARGVLGGAVKYPVPPGHRPGQYVQPTPPPPINFAHRTPVLGGDPNLDEIVNATKSEPKNFKPKQAPTTKSVAVSSPIRPQVVPRDTVSSLHTAINTISDVQQGVLDLLVKSRPNQVIPDPNTLVAFLNEYIDDAPSDEQLLKEFDRRYSNKRVGDENAPDTKRVKTDEIIRYTNVLKEVFAGFPQAPADLRVKMKKAVKNWLKKELLTKFQECVIITKTGEKEHQSYGIPVSELDRFKEWARREMVNVGIEVD